MSRKFAGAKIKLHKSSSNGRSCWFYRFIATGIQENVRHESLDEIAKICKILKFSQNREICPLQIREINVSRKFHVMRYNGKKPTLIDSVFFIYNTAGKITRK